MCSGDLPPAAYVQMIGARCPDTDAARMEKLHNPMLPAGDCLLAIACMPLTCTRLSEAWILEVWFGRQLHI